jgi:hypothetical protein
VAEQQDSDGLVERLKVAADRMDAVFDKELSATLYIREAADLIEAMSRQLVEKGWQPIETAPKDETRCLIWTHELHGYATVASFREYIQGKPDWRSDSGAKMVATYWQPLPGPPKALEGSSDDK